MGEYIALLWRPNTIVGLLGRMRLWYGPPKKKYGIKKSRLVLLTLKIFAVRNRAEMFQREKKRRNEKHEAAR